MKEAWEHLTLLGHLLARELRVLPRKRVFLATRLLVVTMGVAVLGLTLWDQQPSEAGGIIFRYLSWLILALGPPLAMLTGALTLHRELSGRTLGLLVLTGVHLPSLLCGKALAALCQLGLALLTLAPVLCFALSFGGVNAQTMLIGLGLLLATLWTSLSLGLLAGALARREVGVFGWVLLLGLLHHFMPALLVAGMGWFGFHQYTWLIHDLLDPWFGLSQLQQQHSLDLGLNPRLVLSMLSSLLAFWLCARALRWRLRDDWHSHLTVQVWGQRADRFFAPLRLARQAAHRWCQAHAALLNARLPTHWLPAAWRVSRRRPDFSGPHPIMAMEVWRWHRLLGRWLWLYLPVISLLVIGPEVWYDADASAGIRDHAKGIFESWLPPIFFSLLWLLPATWVQMNAMAVSRDYQAGIWPILQLTPLDTRAIMAEKSAAYRRLLRPFFIWLLLSLPVSIKLYIFRQEFQYFALYSSPVWLRQSREYLPIGLLLLVGTLAMGWWGRWCALRFGAWAPIMTLLVVALHFLIMLVLANYVQFNWSSLYDGWLGRHDESLAMTLALLSLATSYALLRHRIRREPVERAS